MRSRLRDPTFSCLTRTPTCDRQTDRQTDRYTTFAAGAVTYNKQQVHDLNVCWNTMYQTVFNFNRWESVKSFINGLEKLSLQYVLKICNVKFYIHLLYAANSFLSDLFWLHYGDCYSADDCLRYVFGPR